MRLQKSGLLAALTVACLLALFPHAQAFTFASQYGASSVTNPAGGYGTTSGGDGSLASSASSSGGDIYGDSNSTSTSTNAGTHTIVADASVDCVSGTVCSDNSGGSSGIGDGSGGYMYDTYTATCGSSCPEGSYVDLAVAWTITGTFGQLSNGTCATGGCGSPYASPAVQSVILPQIYETSANNGQVLLCGGGIGANGCPPWVVDYLPGWDGCVGGSEQEFYCPSSASFTLSGVVYLDRLLGAHGINFAPGQSIQLEFAAEAGSQAGIVTTESVQSTTTFNVFTDTPGVSITSAACGCQLPSLASSTAVSCAPTSIAVNEETTCTMTVTGGGPTPTGYVDLVSGGLVNYCVLSAGSCQATFTPSSSDIGTPTITAVYGGDMIYQGSQDSFQVTVSPRSTSAAVLCRPLADPIGQPTVCTATVTDTSPGTPMESFGTVGFTSSGAGSFSSTSCTLSGGSCAVTYTPDVGSEGSATITGTYGGDANHAGSSGTSTLIVEQRFTGTSLSCLPSSVSVGDPSTCTATVADISGGTPISPTGTVGFSSSATGSFSPATCTLTAGSCAVTYTPNPGSVGTNTITATYGGDTDHFGSSQETNLDVTAHSTSTSLSCSPQNVPVGAPTTCTATVTDTSPGVTITPSGSVIFASGASGTFTPSASCTLSGSGATASCSVTYAPGAHSLGTNKITSKYAGDPSHASSSQTFKVTATVRTTTTTVSCTAPYRANQPTTCTVTVTDTSPGTALTPTGKVAFSSSKPGTFSSATCTLSGSGGSATCQVKFTPSQTGTVKVIAKYAGDADHSASSGSQSFAVT